MSNFQVIRTAPSAKHKPLLILMMLARLKNEGITSQSYLEVEPALTQLLRLFTDSGREERALHPELPFWHLQSDGVWKVSPSCASRILRPRKRGDEYIHVPSLREVNPLGSFDETILNILKENPNEIDNDVSFLLNTYFPNYRIQQLIKRAVGLENVDVNSRYQLFGNSSHHASFQRDVLRAYDSRCAVCDKSTRLINVLLEPIGVYVRHLNFGGDSIACNGIAFCSEHRMQFEEGLFSFDIKGQVYIAQSGILHCSGKRREFNFPSKVIWPQKESLRPTQEVLDWHRDNVFADNVFAPERIQNIELQ